MTKKIFCDKSIFFFFFTVRALSIIGKEEIISLFNHTRKIEEDGGMMIMVSNVISAFTIKHLSKSYQT